MKSTTLERPIDKLVLLLENEDENEDDEVNALKIIK